MRLIIRYFGERLYAVIRPVVKTHEDADDVMQETLLKIHSHFDQFQGNSRLFTWMYRIAYNESLHFLRKKYRGQHTADFKEELLQNLRADPWFSGDEAAWKLEKILAELPERQAEVFRLKYFSGLKYKEIAGILGISEGALKTHYHLAVKKIKSKLSEAD